MKIALYHPWVYLRSGLERSLLELVRRSRHSWTIYTHHYDEEGTYPDLMNFEIVQLSPHVSVERSFQQVMLASLRIMKTKLPMEHFDALVVSSEGIGDFINFRNHSKPIISFCLTPLKIIHDHRTRDFLLQSNPGVQLKYEIFSRFFNLIDVKAWHYFTNIVAISNETKKRILMANLAKEENIQIIHPGVDLKLLKPSWQFEPYFLIPGRIMWQKNIQLGLLAFQRFKERRAGTKFKLIIAGMVDEKSKPYFQELKALANNDPSIEFVVKPTDQQLFSLYQSSYAILFTPRNEDWGIVPLEAMACGKPVISVAEGGPMESVVDGRTGYLVQNDPEHFSTKMEELADNPDLVREMGEAAYEWVQQYDWSFFVDAFDDLIEETVGSSAA